MCAQSLRQSLSTLLFPLAAIEQTQHSAIEQSLTPPLRIAYDVSGRVTLGHITLRATFIIHGKNKFRQKKFQLGRHPLSYVRLLLSVKRKENQATLRLGWAALVKPPIELTDWTGQSWVRSHHCTVLELCNRIFFSNSLHFRVKSASK